VVVVLVLVLVVAMVVVEVVVVVVGLLCLMSKQMVCFLLAAKASHVPHRFQAQEEPEEMQLLELCRDGTHSDSWVMVRIKTLFL
jgi:hypothetical protein